MNPQSTTTDLQLSPNVPLMISLSPGLATQACVVHAIKCRSRLSVGSRVDPPPGYDRVCTTDYSPISQYAIQTSTVRLRCARLR